MGQGGRKEVSEVILEEVAQYGKEEIDVDEVIFVVRLSLLEQKRKINTGSGSRGGMD